MNHQVGVGRRVRREMAISLGFSVLKVAAVLMVVRLADAVFAAGTMGVYLLARRLASTVPNLTGLGVGNALQRCLPALPIGHPAGRRILVRGLSAVLLVNVSMVGGFLLAPEAITGWIFPDDGGYPDLVSFTGWVIALFGLTAVHFAVNGVLMGRRMVLTGKLSDLLAIGGWQLIGFSLLGEAATPTALLRFQVLMMSAGTFVAIPTLLWWERRRNTYASAFAPVSRPLLVFGPTRAAVSFLDAGLITVGPWLLRRDPEAAGAMVIGLTVLRAAAAALTPLSKVAGVAVAELESGRDAHRVGIAVGLLAGGALLISGVTAAALIPAREGLLQLWLVDENTVDAVNRLVLPLLLALPAAGVFLAMKTVVDVRSLFPLNAISLALGIATAAGAWVVLGTWGDPSVMAAWCIAGGHVVLAVGTLLSVRQWLPVRGYFMPARMVASVGLALGSSWLLTQNIPGPVGSLLATALGVTLGISVYILATRRQIGGDLTAFLRGRLTAEVVRA